MPTKIAILDDYNRLGLSIGDWASLKDCEITVFQDHLYDTDALIERSFAALDRTGTALRCTHPLFAEVLAAQGEQAVAASVMGHALQQQPGLVGRERAQARACLQRWGAPAGPMAAWQGPALDVLAQRIVVESALAYAPLIEDLRQGHAAALPALKGSASR